jgi:hypothetical protein
MSRLPRQVSMDIIQTYTGRRTTFHFALQAQVPCHHLHAANVLTRLINNVHHSILSMLLAELCAF